MKAVLAIRRYSSVAWPTVMCKWPRKRAEMPDLAERDGACRAQCERRAVAWMWRAAYWA